MNFFDYLTDAALVLLVVWQVRERPLSIHSLLRPLLIVGIAVSHYLHGIPTAGNDVALIACLAIVGVMFGSSAGGTTVLRRREDGVVLARAGWLAGGLWVAGMGLRFAFAVWASHGGGPTLVRFSAEHSLSMQAWTTALLAMAVGEVLARTMLLALRRQRMAGAWPFTAVVAPAG